MEVLKRKIGENKAAILRDLDLNKDLLAALTRHDVVNLTDCVQLQQTGDVLARNKAFLDMIVSKENDTSAYVTLIECLQRCGQGNVAALLMDVGEEMQILNQIQAHLDLQIKEMQEFLATEERRAGIYLTEPPMDQDSDKPALTDTEVWSKVQLSLKRSEQQLNRCQAVIQKLHKDCETVAKQNADIIEHTKECDAKIKNVLSFGRHSAKQKTVPKKTQDLFANLMDDIEKLVKTRRKVLDKETEGRRHSTRIIRQCRDWVESRCLTLKKLNNPTSQCAPKLENGDEESAVNIQRAAPPANDNAVMSVLDALQLLEKELQEYVHQEITMSDKLRTELRRKHLQKKLHGFNIHGMTEIENALHSLEKDPESLKDNIATIKSSVREINREYCECVSFLNKVDPNNDYAGSEQSNTSSPKAKRRDNKAASRNWPGNFKRTANFGGNLTRSMDNNLHMAGREKTEPNELLNKIKSLAIKHEELKTEDLNLSSKYRIEISKKKREMDLVIQRKDDQLLKLQTDVKEITAEKEKYKKLYNDTKIGYQRNHENNNY